MSEINLHETERWFSKSGETANIEVTDGCMLICIAIESGSALLKGMTAMSKAMNFPVAEVDRVG